MAWLDAPNVPPPVDAVTRDDLAYPRAHGRNADGHLRGRTVSERFDWRYSDAESREIGNRATRVALSVGNRVRLMFGNGSRALAAALTMQSILSHG